MESAKGIYLDNAATTLIDPEVLDHMVGYLKDFYGNASSGHRYGSLAKAVLEDSRRKIANLLQADTSEIMFVSGGTEGNNFLLSGIIRAMRITHVLSSPLEHPSVKKILLHLAELGMVQLTYASVDSYGNFDLEEIECWLAQHPGALLSFMHVNNELGNLTDIHAIGTLCRQYGALLHSDTIQSLYSYDIGQLPVDCAVGSAHKIHGPKGIGFVYVKRGIVIEPLILGGGQEFGQRGGTENIAGIAALAKALEIASRHREAHVTHLKALKGYMIDRLKQVFPDVLFYGNGADLSKSSPNILNISLPSYPYGSMLVYRLALEGIAVSEGSACMSGSSKRSDVIDVLHPSYKNALRISFSKYTTYHEVDRCIEVLLQCSQG